LTLSLPAFAAAAAAAAVAAAAAAAAAATVPRGFFHATGVSLSLSARVNV